MDTPTPTCLYILISYDQHPPASSHSSPLINKPITKYYISYRTQEGGDSLHHDTLRLGRLSGHNDARDFLKANAIPVAPRPRTDQLIASAASQFSSSLAR